MQSKSIQLSLPLEIKDLEKYKTSSLSLEELYALSRKLDGALTKDFICAIPKEFPSDGVYSRERVYYGKDGSKFVKRYILRGKFLESDEDERIYLTAYWRLMGNQALTFQFSLVDYLRFKGVDTNSGANREKFLNYLQRTRSNTWQLNYWFDYRSKKFRQDTQYGIIQKFQVTNDKSPRGKDRFVISIVWTQDYYDALQNLENWKHFALDVYGQIPHTNGILKKLLYFLGNGNNEFATQYPDGIRVKVELKMFCEFFLAMPERTNSWEHKKTLKRPLEQLKEFGLIRVDDVEECFVKEDKVMFVVIWYLPPNFTKSLEPSLDFPSTPHEQIDAETPEIRSLLNETPSGNTLTPPQAKSLELLLFWKVSRKKAEQLAMKHAPEVIEHAVSVLKSYDKPIKSPARFLERALEEGWQQGSLFDPKLEAKKRKEAQAQEQEEKQRRDQEKQLMQQATKQQQAIEAYAAQDDETRFAQVYAAYLQKDSMYAYLTNENQEKLRETLVQQVFPKIKTIGEAKNFIERILTKFSQAQMKEEEEQTALERKQALELDRQIEALAANPSQEMLDQVEQEAEVKHGHLPAYLKQSAKNTFKRERLKVLAWEKLTGRQAW